MAKKNDWGVPDWRDKTAYPKPIKMTPNKWAWEFLRRNHEYRRSWRKSYEQFGLLVAVDPRNGPSGVFFEASTISQFRIPLSPPGIYLPPVQPPPAHKVLINFNLELSIDYQIRMVKRYLKERAKLLEEKGVLKRHNIKAWVKEYPKYLRLLDATDERAKRADIAAHIYTESSNVYPEYLANNEMRKDIEAAKKLRDYSYRFISTAKGKSGK